MSLTFASNLTKMIDAGLGGEVIAPDTSVAIGYRMQYNMVSGPVASWYDPEGGLPVNIIAAIESTQSGSGDPSPENVRPISGRTEVNVWREATHDTSAEPTLTIQLGDTIYGGSLDVTNGVLTVDWAGVDMGDLNYSKSASGLFLSDTLTSVIKRASVSTIPTGQIRSSMYTEISSTSIIGPGGANTSPDGVMALNTQGRLYFNNLSYTDGAAFKTAMSGVQLVYELATPQTIQLSPQTINSLLGQNNVWSDAGDVSVTWKEKLYTEGY